jgi:hypothetical protein
MKTQIKNILLKINPVYRKVNNTEKQLEIVQKNLNQFSDNVEKQLEIVRKTLNQFSESNMQKSIEQQLYDHWFCNNIRDSPPSPYRQYWSLPTTFNGWESHYGEIIQDGMFKAEFLYEKSLLQEIKEKNIEGAVVEFGVSREVRV